MGFHGFHRSFEFRPFSHRFFPFLVVFLVASIPAFPAVFPIIRSRASIGSKKPLHKKRRGVRVGAPFFPLPFLSLGVWRRPPILTPSPRRGISVSAPSTRSICQAG